ncbi:morphogenic membrane protein MmpB [Streptomyces aidingensis]|uniref:Uncharacterized protein n=1 Tax=Streptomyces aidingensis TaxID=910347 RepID=A0A1I1EK11_9ACTN|nr:hypothetical protein [Streptomyces aidingensis]SFB87499.1 hypothetical protein SAMN05421773_101343 [Streptomyces aidingensis]
MLWSDLGRDGEGAAGGSPEQRAAGAMLRRAGWVIAVAMVLAAVLLRPSGG